MGLGMPSLKNHIMLESNPAKSRILVLRLGVSVILLLPTATTTITATTTTTTTTATATTTSYSIIDMIKLHLQPSGKPDLPRVRSEAH